MLNNIANPEYERYIHGSAWRRKADERLEIDGHTCCVCGGKATEVHHLTYDNFGNEKMDDLVSLCRGCHEKAEELYDPAVTPWAMESVTPDCRSFMGAMSTDAAVIAPIVFSYLMKVHGAGFAEMMEFRQPVDKEGRKYWGRLRKAVIALCGKRYYINCREDRSALMLEGITNRVAVICLAQIEHDIRNRVQAELHEIVGMEYAIFEKWKDVAEYLGISQGTLGKLRKDDGSSYGPTLRETVLYYCSLDAAAGNKPPEGFRCLTADDYRHLNGMADYARTVMEEEA